MTDPEPRLTGDPHPECWDLICVGTGLAEAMLAGCARWTHRSIRQQSSRPRASAPGPVVDADVDPSDRRPPSLPPSLSPSPPSQRRGEGGKERAPPRRVRRVRRRVGRPRGRGAARLGMAPPARSSRERRRREGGFGRPAREPRRGDAAFDADADAPAPRARRACRIVDVPRILRARPERGRRRAARRAGRDASPLRARSRRAQARVLRRRRRRRARRLRRAQLLRVQGVGANEGVVGRRAEGRPGVQGGGVPRPRVAARR